MQGVKLGWRPGTAPPLHPPSWLVGREVLGESPVNDSEIKGQQELIWFHFIETPKSDMETHMLNPLKYGLSFARVNKPFVIVWHPFNARNHELFFEFFGGLGEYR